MNNLMIQDRWIQNSPPEYEKLIYIKTYKIQIDNHNFSIKSSSESSENNPWHEALPRRIQNFIFNKFTVNKYSTCRWLQDLQNNPRMHPHVKTYLLTRTQKLSNICIYFSPYMNLDKIPVFILVLKWIISILISAIA